MDILTIWFPKCGPYSASCGNKDKKHRVTYSIFLSVTRFVLVFRRVCQKAGHRGHSSALLSQI